jgi:hypothetical protein
MYPSASATFASLNLSAALRTASRLGSGAEVEADAKIAMLAIEMIRVFNIGVLLNIVLFLGCEAG